LSEINSVSLNSIQSNQQEQCYERAPDIFHFINLLLTGKFLEMKRYVMALWIFLFGLIIFVVVWCFILAQDKALPLTLVGMEEKTVPEIPTNHRFGISAVQADKYDISSTGAGWYINWTYKPAEKAKLEFMPLIAGYTRDKNVSDKYMEELKNYILNNPQYYPDDTIFMVGNEIGYAAQHDMRTPEQYPEDFHRCYELLKSINPNYKLAVGAAILSMNQKYVLKYYVEGKGGIHYLKRVRESYVAKYGQEMPVDYYTVTCHIFENKGVDLETFKEHIIRFRKFLADEGEREKPLIITEYGCVLKGPDAQEIVNYMKETFDFLNTARDDKIGCTTDGNRLVQRWCWFTMHGLKFSEKLKVLGPAAFLIKMNQTSLVNPDGLMNCLGKTYQNYIYSTQEN